MFTEGKRITAITRSLLAAIFIVLGFQADAQIRMSDVQIQKPVIIPAKRPAIKIADLERMLSQDYTTSANDLQKIGWIPGGFTDSLSMFYYSVGETPGQTNHLYYVYFRFKKQYDGTPLVSATMFMSYEPSITAPFSSETVSRNYKLVHMDKIDEELSIQLYENGKYSLGFSILHEEGKRPTYSYAISTQSDSDTK